MQMAQEPAVFESEDRGLAVETRRTGLGKRVADRGAGSAMRAAGELVLRYGLALVIGWIGLMKFTEYEARGIEPLVANSPLMSWMYGFLSVREFSAALGVVEVSIAILIGLRHWWPKAAAVGSGAAVLMFLTTLSFLFTTPGWEPSLGGFPALSGHPGQFLLKDVILLGAALWSCGEAWGASAVIRPLR